MKFEIGDKVVIDLTSISLFKDDENVDKEFLKFLKSGVDGEIVEEYISEKTESMGANYYKVAFDNGTILHCLNGKHLMLKCLAQVSMSYEEIGKVITYFKLGEPLEWYDRTMEIWKDSRADSLDEIMWNILDCSSQYRVKEE